MLVTKHNNISQTFWIFTHTKPKHESKIKTETMYKKKCKMHKMHEDMTFNA